MNRKDGTERHEAEAEEQDSIEADLDGGEGQGGGDQRGQDRYRRDDVEVLVGHHQQATSTDGREGHERGGDEQAQGNNGVRPSTDPPRSLPKRPPCRRARNQRWPPPFQNRLTDLGSGCTSRDLALDPCGGAKSAS